MSPHLSPHSLRSYELWPQEWPVHVARHAGVLQRLPRFVRARSGALVHPYVEEREESLRPETYRDPHIFRLTWEECARSEGQVALAVIKSTRCGPAGRGRREVARPNLNRAPGVCRPKCSALGLHGVAPKLLPENPNLSSASLRDPLPPPPPRTWPERRDTCPGSPSRRDRPSLGSPLPPAAAAASRLAALPPAPWKNRGKPASTGDFSSGVSGLAAFGWDEWGSCYFCRCEVAPRSPGRASEAPRRPGAASPRVPRRLRPPLLPRARVCLYRIWKLGGLAHPLPAARPPLPGSGSRTWSAPAASRRKAGASERGAGNRELARRCLACRSPSPAAPSPTARPGADSASPASVPSVRGEGGEDVENIAL